MGFVSLGRFVPGTSLLHRLDPRAKLACAALVALGAVWASRLSQQSMLSFFLLTGFLGARLPARLLLRALRGVVWLLAAVACVNVVWMLVARSAAWAQGPESVQSVTELAVLLLRLVNLLMLGVLFTATTVPVDAAEALEALLRPLARLRVPVREIGLLLVLSLSFIPVFLDEAQGLVRAHRVKVGRARWGWRARAGAVVPLLVPLFLGVQRRAEDLAIALDSRCYSPLRARTSLVAARFGRLETVVLVVCTGMFMWIVFSGSRG